MLTILWLILFFSGSFIAPDAKVKVPQCNSTKHPPNVRCVPKL